MSVEEEKPTPRTIQELPPKHHTEETEGFATALVSGLGCLGFSVLPLSIMALVVLLVVLLGFMRGCPSADMPPPPPDLPVQQQISE